MTTYRLPEQLRPALATPFGPVHQTAGALEATRGRVVVAVGDVVTRTFLEHGVLPRLMLVDGVTKRSVVENALADLPREGVRRIEVENPAATITDALWSRIEEALRDDAQATLIQVIGEEDLAALPAMLLAPEGAAVCYGQPDEGVVVVEITPDVRTRAQGILNRMEVE